MVHVELPRLALSIRQPWAWAILHAGKDIENRNWNTRVRGQIWIHAAKGCTEDEYLDAVIGMPKSVLRVPPLAEMARGGIVGCAWLRHVVPASDSPWFDGKYGFVLEDVKPVPFVPCQGALGFWRVPDAVLEQLRRSA